MYIKELTLHNFRNYSEQIIEYKNGVNLLVGANGQGKTNCLEGIYYLLTGKSYRVRQENELIFWGRKNFYLSGNFEMNDRDLQLESYYESGKKVVRINRLPCKRLSDYVGTINAVFFSPDDLNIVKKSPNERRKFLDLFITQIKPSHINLLNSYLKIIRQKNFLLRQEKNIGMLKKQLLVWNDQLLNIGTKILTNRFQFTEELNKYSRVIFKNIFSKQDSMDLYYIGLGKKDLAECLLFFPELLEKKMDQEIEKKSVLFGPHRDDLLIVLNGRLAKLYGSQGQQRASVLCLKLAEMEIIFKEKNEYPILLLDDVFSELDEYRKEYLNNYIRSSKKQTIMTMTGEYQNMIKQDNTIYYVQNGKIKGGK